MKVAVFDSKPYDQKFFSLANKEFGYDFHYLEARLNSDTVELARGYDAICLFVNDTCDAEVAGRLEEFGVGLVLMRCAGFDRIDVDALREFGITVARVPAYSPHGVAEFAVSLLLCLNRKIHVAYNRVRDGNFTLVGLEGLDIHGKTVGVVGTGKIGQCFIDIMLGFHCNILAYDLFPNQEYARKEGVTYVELDELFKNADIISLHAPLTEATRYLINADTIKLMKNGVILLNTSRGGLVNTKDLVDALKAGKMRGAALDVYEEEEGYFFEDRTFDVILDDTLARLQNMRNVLITSHQAFLTEEALTEISKVTFQNLNEFASGLRFDQLANYVPPPPPAFELKRLESRGMVSGNRRKSFLEQRKSSKFAHLT